MEPTTAIGLGLGAASLAIQLADGARKGIVAYDSRIFWMVIAKTCRVRPV